MMSNASSIFTFALIYYYREGVLKIRAQRWSATFAGFSRGQSEFLWRKQERVDDGNRTVTSAGLKILAKKPPALHTFRRCENQTVPVRQLSLIDPVPGAANQSDRDFRWAPLREVFYHLTSNLVGNAHLANRVHIEFVQDLPTQGPAPVFPESINP